MWQIETYQKDEQGWWHLLLQDFERQYAIYLWLQQRYREELAMWIYSLRFYLCAQWCHHHTQLARSCDSCHTLSLHPACHQRKLLSMCVPLQDLHSFSTSTLSQPLSVSVYFIRSNFALVWQSGMSTACVMLYWGCPSFGRDSKQQVTNRTLATLLEKTKQSYYKYSCMKQQLEYWSKE